MKDKKTHYQVKITVSNQLITKNKTTTKKTKHTTLQIKDQKYM
jgi:hypothetical protein